MYKTQMYNLRYKYFALLIILFFVVGFIYHYVISQKQQEYLNESTYHYNQTYNLVYNQYKEMSNLIFGSLLELTDTKNQFRKLQTLPKDEYKNIREEFYKKTLTRYELLKIRHIKSINYILSDDTMFLKMNTPKKYGQKTSNKRHSVNFVHDYKKPFDTYEIGKYGEGFRFVYPIMDKGEYLGIIEITYGADAITSTIMKQNDVWSNFQIRAKNFNTEILNKESKKYLKSIHPGYILDKNVIKILKKEAELKHKKLLPSKKTQMEVFKALQKDIAHSIYDEKFSQIFTLIPVFHKITKEKEAVLVIRSNHEPISSLNKFYYFGFVILFIIVFLIIFPIYQNSLKMIQEKEELEKEQRLQAKLLKSQEDLKKIFDSAQVGLMYITGDRFLIQANKALSDIFGYDSPQEMVGISMRKLHLSEENFIDYGQKNFYPLQMGVNKNIEYPLRKKDGSIIWCEMAGKAIDNNIPADMSQGVLWVINDITLRKEYQLEIERQKEEFETIFNYAHDGIAIIDLDRNFLNFNRAFLNMTGFTAKRLKKENCSNLTSPADREKNDAAINEAISTGRTVVIEKECTLQGDSTVSVIMSVTLLPDHKRLLLLLHDTTIEKTIQEQSKLASMGEMIGNIAHQWRQPLSIISTGATGMIFKKENGILSDESIINTCEEINTHAQYLSRTIDDFKNFIKGDRIKEKFLVQDLMDSFFNLVQGSVKNNDIKMIFDIEDNIKINGYENELIQCLLNIFNNAKDVFLEKTLEENYILISAKEENNQTIITIKDNAGGIPKRIINRVFEAYFTTKHQTQGTGLGLHMVYNLITKGMEGSIEVHNETYEYKEKEYTGACFIISLPKE